MSRRDEKAIRRRTGTSTPTAIVTAVAVSLLVACLSAGSALPQPEAPAAPPGDESIRRQQEEAPPREEDEADRSSGRRQVEEVEREESEASDEKREGLAVDDLERPGEGYLWGGRRSRRPDPTVTAEGALTMFMRARNYRTIRMLKSVMTPSLQASYDRDSARFNGKQNVRLSAFYFQPEDLKAVHYTGPKGAREADIYDATVRSLWTDQGELADRRLEVVRLAQEESGLWRVGRLDIKESDRSRFQEQIPSVTSLRKVLRAWHRRQAALARPLLSQAFLQEHSIEGEGPSPLFEGDPSLRHAGFEVLEILWTEGATEATALVDLYVTARNRFGALEPQSRRIGLVRVGAGWYVDSWVER